MSRPCISLAMASLSRPRDSSSTSNAERRSYYFFSFTQYTHADLAYQSEFGNSCRDENIGSLHSKGLFCSFRLIRHWILYSRW